MPIYDYQCLNPACDLVKDPDKQGVEEYLVPRFDSPNPPCAQCGGATEKTLPRLRRHKNGWHANHSSLRLHFNYQD